MSAKLGQLTGLYQDALECRRLARAAVSTPPTAEEASYLAELSEVVAEIYAELVAEHRRVITRVL